MEKKRMKTGAFLRRYGRIIVSGVVLFLIALVAIFAPLIADHDPNLLDVRSANIKPCEEFKFGTDTFGRDIFSRVVYGTRVSLGISIAVNALAIIIGSLLGLLCGFYKAWDHILMRILEGLATLPTVLIAIVMVTILGPGVGKLITVLVLVNLPGIARLVRQRVMSIKETEFVESAKASGATDMRLMIKYILPQTLSPLIIRFTNGLGATVLTQASMSFLGVGLDPRIPTWGGIVNEGRLLVMVYPYQVVYAGVAIAITVFAFAILGDGVRDVLDPTLR